MERGKGRELEGLVTKHKMKKTIVVKVRRKILHPLYKKYMVQAKKYYVHDETEEAALGDLVKFRSSKPISKLKRWRLKTIVKKAAK